MDKSENTEKQAEGSPAIREAIFRMADINRNLLDRFAACVLDVDLEAIAAMTVDNIADGFDAALLEDDDKYLKRIVEVSTLMRNGPKKSAANKQTNEQEPRIYDLSKYLNLHLSVAFAGRQHAPIAISFDRPKDKALRIKLAHGFEDEDEFRQKITYGFQGIRLRGLAELKDEFILSEGEYYSILFTDHEGRSRFILQIDDWTNPKCESIGWFTAYDENKAEIAAVCFQKPGFVKLEDESEPEPKNAVDAVLSTLGDWIGDGSGSIIPIDWREQLSAVASCFEQKSQTPSERPVIEPDKYAVFSEVLLTILDDDRTRAEPGNAIRDALQEIADDLYQGGDRQTLTQLYQGYKPGEDEQKGGQA